MRKFFRKFMSAWHRDRAWTAMHHRDPVLADYHFSRAEKWSKP